MPHDGPCPDVDVLQRLANNQLDPKEAFTLQRHLVHCPVCNAMVQELRDASRVLAAAPTSMPTITGGTSYFPAPAPVAPAVEPSGNEHDFLAPPQQPDELGRLGNYRVLRLLGAGGMGMVFLAEDLSLERKVALKVMRPQASNDDTSRKRFLREAKLVASLEHDHIVAVYQVGEDHNVLYLAMQLLQGENLEEKLDRDRKLPIAEVLRIGREAAEGLSAAHERGLVHRDIKPSNLWLEARGSGAKSTPFGRVKLLDFGLARDASGGGEHYTKSGFVVGTAGYIAPEQARGQAADARSDLFSLGCVLYEAATGTCAFRGADAMSRLTALAVDQPASPQALNPHVPEKLANLILWMLAKAPDQRPESARQVIAAIEAIEQDRMDEGNPAPDRPPLGRGNHSAKPAHPPAAHSEAEKSLSTTLVILVALAVGIVGFVVLQFLR